MKRALASVVFVFALLTAALALTPGQRAVLFSATPNWWNAPKYQGAAAVANFRAGLFAITTVAVGNIPTATVAQLSTMRASSFSEWITFTALSTTTRTYVNSAGLIANNLSVNQPRFPDYTNMVQEFAVNDVASATNVTLYSRDLTQAAWSSSNIIPLLNQVGIDGTSNSASTITATAGNATVLQSVTLASSQRFQSAYIKRVTGTGTLNMTTDGGTTWTALTSSNCFNIPAVGAAINASSFVRCQIPAQTVTNPSFGFQIVTNGDAFVIDGVQNETGNYASPIILTAGSVGSRTAETVKLAAIPTALLALAQGTVVLRGKSNIPGAAGNYLVFLGMDNARSMVASYNSATSVSATNGAQQLSATLGSGTLSLPFGAVFAWSGSGRALAGNGGSVGSDANAVGTHTSFYLARTVDNSNTGPMWADEIVIFPTTLTNTQLQAQAHSYP